MIRRDDIDRVDVLAIDEIAKIPVDTAPISVAHGFGVVLVDSLLSLRCVAGVDVAHRNYLLMRILEHPIQVPSGPMDAAADEAHVDPLAGSDRTGQSQSG